MALSPVQFAGAPSKSAEQKTPEVTWVDKVIQGLQIAKGITGIASDYQTIQKYSADRDALADTRAGVSTAAENAKRLENGMEFVPKGTQGAMQLPQRRGDEVDQNIWMRQKVKEEKTPLLQIKTTAADGSPLIKLVKGQEGAEYPGYIAPKDTAGRDARTDKQTTDAVERAQKSLNRDLKDVDEAIASADQVRTLGDLAKTNPVAANNLASRLARVAGEKGILTDSDLERQGGSAAFQDRLNRYIQKSTTGQALLPEDIKFANEFAEIMGRANSQQKARITERNVQQFTRAHKGDFKENYGMITGYDWKDPDPAQTPEAPPAKAPQGGMNVANAAGGGAPTRLAPTKSGYMPGSEVMLHGVRYRIAEDGDTLVPVAAGGK